jgi:preprotein translocase subunit SecD
MTKEEAKAKAEQILNTVKTNPQDFDKQAKDNSADKGNADKGGDLNFFAKGQMVPEFENAIFTASTVIGQVLPQAVETQFGYHIIKVTGHTDAINETKNEPQVKYQSIVLNLKSVVPQEGWAETGLTGKQFKRADVTFDQMGKPQVSIKLNEEGTTLFAALTKKNFQKPIAIFLDGKLLTSPTVQAEITSGEAVISGSFDTRYAMSLARDMNTGAIPAPITLVAQNNIGPLIGEKALQDAMYASLLAFIIIAVFMIWYYKRSGLVSIIGLIFYVVMMMALIKLIPITLSVAGIAGVILSVGMAIDANVLIFERMKEEMNLNHRSLKASIDIGFLRAWTAIRDSNLSTLLTAFILFTFGTGMIRGFALILITGILVSMFTAIYVTKMLLVYLVNTKLGEKNEGWV